MERQKIKSVVELSRYKIGDVLYKISFVPVGAQSVVVPAGDEWITSCHPKVMFERKLVPKSWPYRSRLPRMPAPDFNITMSVLTSELTAIEFAVALIGRCHNTGEFYYSNHDGDGEWVPESCLWPTAAGADRERDRIRNLFACWARGPGGVDQ